MCSRPVFNCSNLHVEFLHNNLIKLLTNSYNHPSIHHLKPLILFRVPGGGSNPTDNLEKPIKFTFLYIYIYCSIQYVLNISVKTQSSQTHVVYLDDSIGIISELCRLLILFQMLLLFEETLRFLWSFFTLTSRETSGDISENEKGSHDCI